MKKLLLILLCLPMIGFGQFQYKLDSVSFTDTTFTADLIKFEYDSQGNCVKLIF